MGPMMYWFFKRADDHEKDQPFYYFRMLDPDFTPHPVYDALKQYAASARWLGTGFHQENDWAVEYGGTWSLHASERAAAGLYRTGVMGSQLRFAFRGTGAELALLQNPYGGLIETRVDDQAPREIDLRATDPGSQGRVVLAEALPDGEHHVDVAVSRGDLNLDGIVIRRTNEYLVSAILWLAAAALSLAAAFLAIVQARRGVGR
jgi:hypothetical protein